MDDIDIHQELQQQIFAALNNIRTDLQQLIDCLDQCRYYYRSVYVVAIRLEGSEYQTFTVPDESRSLKFDDLPEKMITIRKVDVNLPDPRLMCDMTNSPRDPQLGPSQVILYFNPEYPSGLSHGCVDSDYRRTLLVRQENGHWRINKHDCGQPIGRRTQRMYTRTSKEGKIGPNATVFFMTKLMCDRVLLVVPQIRLHHNRAMVPMHRIDQNFIVCNQLFNQLDENTHPVMCNEMEEAITQLSNEVLPITAELNFILLEANEAEMATDIAMKTETWESDTLW